MKLTLAELKRRLQPGTRITMTRHDWYPQGPLMHIQREVVDQDGTYCHISSPIEGKVSYMTWPLARHLRATPVGFEVRLSSSEQDNVWMGYAVEGWQP